MMRVLLVVLVMLLTGPALAQTIQASSVPDEAVQQVIRPAMTNFQREATGLVQAMSGLCLKPSQAALVLARDRFARTALTYAQIELIRIGPLMEENRAERLLFWPDRRGIGLRQVQAILADQDETATTPEGLAAKSVAVQGLGALEFVLFGTDAEQLADTSGGFRCRYGSAISQNVAALAGELQSGWYSPSGVAIRLMAPRPEYPDYRTDTEALEALVGALAHGAEAVRDQRLLPFIARAGQEANPKQALFWRSGLTMAMIRANMDGLRRLFERSGVARVGEAGAGGIDQSIAIQFDRATAALDAVTAPVEEAVADPSQVQALSDLVSATQMLQVVIGEQLAAALDLSVGFSSMDGD